MNPSCGSSVCLPASPFSSVNTTMWMKFWIPWTWRARSTAHSISRFQFLLSSSYFLAQRLLIGGNVYSGQSSEFNLQKHEAHHPFVLATICYTFEEICATPFDQMDFCYFPSCTAGLMCDVNGLALRSNKFTNLIFSNSVIFRDLSVKMQKVKQK